MLSTKTPHILILHVSEMLCFHVPTCTIYWARENQLEKLFKADIDLCLYATTNLQDQ